MDLRFSIGAANYTTAAPSTIEKTIEELRRMKPSEPFLSRGADRINGVISRFGVYLAVEGIGEEGLFEFRA